MGYFTGILQNDVLLLFLTVGLGAIIGKVSFKHVRIGSSGILFAGLILGALGGTVTGQFFSFNLVIFIVAVGLLAARDIVWPLKHHGVNFITLGIVELDQGVRATGRLDIDEPRIGMRVRVGVGQAHLRRHGDFAAEL